MEAFMKIDRLLSIVVHLLSRDLVSASDLANRFGVTVRTEPGPARLPRVARPRGRQLPLRRILYYCMSMDISEVLKALADPNRLRILNLLHERTLCVCDLESILKLNQSNLSRHLATLRHAGIVTVGKKGSLHLLLPRAAPEALWPGRRRVVRDHPCRSHVGVRSRTRLAKRLAASPNCT